MAESIFKTKHDKVEGIWIRGDYEQNASAFSKETHDSLYAIEDSSWWFQYRMSLISLLVNKYYSKDITIVDVGGGNGYTTKKLIEEGFACLLIEPSIEGCLNAVKRGIPEIFCDAIIKENIVPKSIRQIVILDVLEHLESDEDMIQTLAYALQDQGKIVITVPAFSCLWSSEDDAAGHFRRYRIKQLKSLLERMNFYRGTEFSYPSNKELFAEYAKANRFDPKETIFVKRILQTVLPEQVRNYIASDLFEAYVGISEEQLAYELYMSEEQIKTMKRHGMFIGVHGYDHYWLGNLPIEKMHADISKALEVMEAFIDRKQWVMNYPYGNYNTAVLDYIETQGACLGLTTQPQVADLARNHKLELPRLDCNDFPPKSEQYKQL